MLQFLGKILKRIVGTLVFVLLVSQLCAQMRDRGRLVSLDKMPFRKYGEQPIEPNTQRFLYQPTQYPNLLGSPDLKLLFTFDSHSSFLLNQRAKFFGLRLGLEFFGNYRVGLGWYFLRKPIPLQDIVRPEDTLMQNLRFNYSTIFFEYVIYKDFKWEAVAALPLGRGIGIIDTVSTLNKVNGAMREKNVTVIAPSVGGHYKLFYWLGVGSGVGYRFVVSPEQEVRKSLSAPFYVIKVKLFLGGIYKAIFKPDLVKIEREAWEEKREERRQRRKERREQRNQE